MDCSDCPHDKTIQLTKIAMNGIEKAVVCSECPKRDPLLNVPKQPGDFSLVEFLAGIKPAKSAPEVPKSPPVPDCPVCKLSFEEFRKTGRLGCSHDYEVFRPALLPLIEKIQSDTAHVGSVPKRAVARLEREAELERLRAALAEAVLEERYENAATLRDAIQALESQGG